MSTTHTVETVETEKELPFHTVFWNEILNRWDRQTSSAKRNYKIGGTIAVLILLGTILAYSNSSSASITASADDENKFAAAIANAFKSIHTDFSDRINGAVGEINKIKKEVKPIDLEKFEKSLLEKLKKDLPPAVPISALQETNRNVARIDAEQKKQGSVLANLSFVGSAQGATPASIQLPGFPQATPAAPAKPASTDYTRYNQLVADCEGAWTPDASKKDQTATKLNGYSAEQMQEQREKCYATKRAQQQAAKEQFNRQQSTLRQPVQQQVQPEPQAQDDEVVENEVAPADVSIRDPRMAMNMGVRAGYQSGGSRQPGCPQGFHFDARERSCIRHTEVSGPSPYNVPDNVARCRPGSTRTIEVRGPNGQRRVVQQVCNVHR